MKKQTRKSVVGAFIHDDLVVITHGRNTMMVLEQYEADALAQILDELIYDETESHQYLSEQVSLLKVRVEELEHDNEYLKEELEVCR